MTSYDMIALNAAQANGQYGLLSGQLRKGKGYHMQSTKGTNIKDIKYHNRLLILKHIAVKPLICRMDLSEATDLSKMAVGNIVDDLLEMKLVEETLLSTDTTNYGRLPKVLQISKNSPLICGILLKRGVSQVILADLSGAIIDREEVFYDKLPPREYLSDCLAAAYKTMRARQERQVIAVGISSVGLVDDRRGVIINSPFSMGYPNWKSCGKSLKLPTFPPI